LLAVILAMWSARWFGPFARLPAGLACLTLIPLWEQDRGADIDALNTLASVITAMLLLEIISAAPGTQGQGRGPNPLPEHLARGPEKSSSLWIIALSISLGATLLLKGPGGFPPILGALIGPSLLLRDWRWVRRPSVWIGLLIGIAIFAAYGAAAKVILHHQGITTDTGGLREAMQRLVIHKFSAIIPSILAQLTTLLYAVPVSIALLFAARGFADRRGLVREAASGKIIALFGTIGAAFMIWILAGNDNPRYEYVALPLLAPLVGAVAVDWKQGGDDILTNPMRRLLAAFNFLWAGVAIAMIALIWNRSDDHATLAVTGGVAVVAGIFAVVFWTSSRYRPAAITWILVILCLAVPLAERKNLERQKKSARSAALQLRQLVNNQPIGVVSMNRDMPELFYYADLPVTAYGERGLNKLVAVPGGQWVVLSQNKTFPEFSTLTSQVPGAFPHGVTRLKMPDPRDIVYVGWYDPTPLPGGGVRAIKLPPVSANTVDSDED
jgi:4-amino-4-deoxy-L-arabinose transferase-like glycosyltransferase